MIRNNCTWFLEINIAKIKDKIFFFFCIFSCLIIIDSNQIKIKSIKKKKCPN